MSAAGVLELRILSGIHEGAFATLGEAALLLGSAPDCDIVLADPGVQPRHARLEPAGGGWQLVPEPSAAGGGEAPPVPLEPGVAATVGPVLLTVDVAGAPWRPPEQLKLTTSGPAAAVPLALMPDAGGATAGAEPAQPPAGESGAAAQAPIPEAEPAPALPAAGRGRTLAVAALGVGLLLAAAALLAWALQPAAQPVAATAPASAPFAGSAGAAAIQAVIDGLGLGQRAVVEGQEGDWRVRATYLNDNEIEALAGALSKLRPRPGLRIRSEQDLQQDVAEALGRLLPGEPGRVKASYLGDARFRLEGRLATDEERQALLAGLRGAFPQVREWDNQLLVPQDQAERLLAQLRAAGFDGVTGRWQDGKLYIEAKVLRQQVPQWERALMQAVARYPVPISATLAPQSQAQDLALARLPFQLRSVMGGDLPYVVLADGGKLIEGGSRQGWRLVSVDGEKVVFENGTRRAVVPR